MIEKVNNAVAYAGTTLMSLVSFANGVEWLGIISTLAGAAMACASAYEKIEDARYRRLERKKLEREVEGKQ